MVVPTATKWRRHCGFRMLADSGVISYNPVSGQYHKRMLASPCLTSSNLRCPGFRVRDDPGE
jgi:hypothetical protein